MAVPVRGHYEMEAYMNNQTKDQAAVIALIEEQQKKLPEYSTARMVGEQLKGIVMMDQDAAALLAEDLRVKGKGIADAEKKVKARADEIHKTQKGNGVAVPPWEAEDILRQFYGLPERRWGPGKENNSSGPSAQLPAKKAEPERVKVIDLTEFF